MKVTHLLFVAEAAAIGTATHQEVKRYTEFALNAAQTIGQVSEAQKLNEWTYLLPAASALHCLGKLLSLAESSGVRVRVLPLHDPPAWLESA